MPKNGGLVGKQSTIINRVGSGMWDLNDQHIFAITNNWGPAIGTLVNPATSGMQLKNLGYPSGVYHINWDGTNVYQVRVENNLEGGGWMQILNYVRSADTNPDLTVRTSSFPLLNAEYTLGTSESSSTGVGGTWGHISNSLANSRAWTEYMFYGKTGNHSRIIHFRGNNSSIVSYIKTGQGGMTPHHRDSGTNFSGSLRVNSTIPLHMSTSEGFANEGNLALTNFPMYGESSIGNPRAHWGIKGVGNRWEVDDGGTAAATIHRVWVR
jgi:hypothetical protein